MRQLLLFTQVALGTVLLVGAGLSMRSLVELMRVDPGFDLKNVLTAMISLDREKYPEKDAQSFAQRLIERIAAMPGVRRVGFSGHMSPLSGSMAWTVVDQIEGYAAKPGEQLQLSWTGVGPGYFSLLGVPVVAGREFDHTDVLGSSRSILVNQAFVRQYWPNLEPLGRRLQDGTVVGVVADTRSLRLSEAAAPTVYTSLTQGGIGAITLLIKTEQDPSSLAPMVRRELAALDSSAWPPRFSTLQETWSDSLAPQRALLSLLGAFSGLALVLSAIGLYGFVACSVAQRTREIGIRMAVGARRHDILGLVLRQSLGLAVLGLASGIALALLAVRIIRDFLYGIGPSDPLALTGVVTVQLIVACLACWLPARRATKVDPVIALRTE
ncbi:MAG: FtsX-like permease family protein [Lacunisphaera sp.]